MLRGIIPSPRALPPKIKLRTLNVLGRQSRIPIRRQERTSIKMKQHIVRFLHAGWLCLAVSLTSAVAQSSQMLTVDLPFAFQVNNQQFPAGHYRVSVDDGLPAVRLQNVESKQSAFSISSPIQSEKTREVPSLVFTRYDD